MTYYKPQELIVFALLGEIKIVNIRQSGSKKTFPTVAHWVFDSTSLPIGMDVGTHKLTGKLLIFVACQAFREREFKASKDSESASYYISVLEVDDKKAATTPTGESRYHVDEIKRIWSNNGQIAKILYKEEYGLIMACYRGYIESYDPVHFNRLNYWANNMKAIGSEQQKAKVEQ